jgi:hypothetical protein
MKCSYIIASIIIAGGLVGFGYFASKNIKASGELIEVKGLSEKVVRADIGDISITISNKCDNLEELYNKRMLDRAKIIKFIKSHGIGDEEIMNSSADTEECNDEDKTTDAQGSVTTKKYKYFKSTDKVTIRSKDLAKLNKVKEEIVKLSAEGILINFHYSYRLTNFADIKLAMMREASENAKKNAEACLDSQEQKIGNIVYLRQGEITIRAEDESEDTDSWNSTEKTSMNKRLRLIVRAGFSKSSR